MKNQVEIKGANLYLEENKYLIIAFKPNITIDLEIAELVTEKIEGISGHIPHGNIVDASQMFFMKNEARKHFAKQEKKNAKGIAIVTKSKIQANFANLYFKFTKRTIETKLFTDIPSAKTWLDTKFN